MQAVAKFGSSSLIDSALFSVRKRFLNLIMNQLAAHTIEHGYVKSRIERVPDTVLKQRHIVELFQATKDNALTILLFDTTVIGGKYLRSVLALDSFHALNPNCSCFELNRMAECASLLEMIHSFYLIVDDIMDESETRRGKLCWHKNANVGLSAVNDAMLLDVFIDEIIRELYVEHPQVDRLCACHQNSKRITLLGQLLDTISVREFDAFTWDRYEQMVEMKTSHYTFFQPIELAMLISDRMDHHRALRHLAYQIGFLFQSQDDLLDVFGDPKVTGKIGTDIQDGKCTWVSVRAIQKLHGKPELNDFKAHYGRTDLESINNIKTILQRLNIQEDYANFERNYTDKLRSDINQKIPPQLSPLVPVLHAVVTKLLSRKK